jgi:hypothetical protein
LVNALAGLQTYGLLIRPAKTSYTTGTLYDMGAKFVGKYKKIVENWLTR